MRARLGHAPDSETICRIYNQGIEGRTATFETQLRTPGDVVKWFYEGDRPIVVVEEDGKGIIAFASSSEYRSRHCYRGIAEFSVYVEVASRGRGAGRLALSALIDESAKVGIWKLLSRIFVENVASRALVQSLGFREVGVYEKHAQLEGVWRDVVIVEKCLEVEPSN